MRPKPQYCRRFLRLGFSTFTILVLLLLAYINGLYLCMPTTPPPPHFNLFPGNAAASEDTHFSPLPRPVIRDAGPSRLRRRRRVGHTRRGQLRILRPGPRAGRFAGRVRDLFAGSEPPCKVRFFMTWISPAETFGEREVVAVERLFRSHPSGCLVIVSTSLDSASGNRTLHQFVEKGLRVAAVSPDLDYLLGGTPAQSWLDGLRKGRVDPGEVPLGQNLSNLLRLSLLYRFGGVYIDADVLVLKDLSRVRNSIGAQAVDVGSGNWSRLNNAVLIFDKGHPLVYRFIKEFALTFNGNKWGHNGPYLVSRVVADGGSYDLTVLPPSAFYPVDWSRIGGLFRRPSGDTKWMRNKMENIRRTTLALHLWNTHSKNLNIENGSIIHHLLQTTCNNSNSTL